MLVLDKDCLECKDVIAHCQLRSEWSREIHSRPPSKRTKHRTCRMFPTRHQSQPSVLELMPPAVAER